jgi:cytochrome c peroxidase
MKASYQWLAVAATSMALFAALTVTTQTEFGAPATSAAPVAHTALTPEVDSPFAALPLSVALEPRRLALGERLFHEGRLSADGMVSCAHCHQLSNGGADRLPLARGVEGKEGAINTPTVFNSGLNFRQFWDGRAATLEEQVDGPLQNPIEMANTWPKVLATLQDDPSYRSEFAATYPDGITAANVRDAIATFERSLNTPNARFDQFLRGNLGALNEAEQAGYRLFKQIGCTSCHQGVNVGGNMYQKLGVMEDYFDGSDRHDTGRFKYTRREDDRYYRKVPSLRNVAVTAPYLHDASAATLEDAVRIMARYQLGKHLDGTEVSNIVAFLRTLTGEYQGKPLQ